MASIGSDDCGTAVFDSETEFDNEDSAVIVILMKPHYI